MKADGVNPNRLFGGESRWNEVLGPFYDEAILQEFGLLPSEELISIQAQGVRYYPHGQFKMGSSHLLQPRVEVIEFWNTYLRPAVEQSYIDQWTATAYLLQPRGAEGKEPSRADVIADPETTFDQLYEIEEHLKRTLAAWKHGTTLS